MAGMRDKVGIHSGQPNWRFRSMVRISGICGERPL